MAESSLGFSVEQAKAFGKQLSERIVAVAGDAKRFRPWTEAVYVALKELAQDQQWDIFPKETVCKGEYLCDFMLFEAHYGCRVACESQWWHGIREHQVELDWALEKLRGVKADIKLFILEGTAAQWDCSKRNCLTDYAQLSTKETFLVLRWERTKFTHYVWQPKQDGVQFYEHLKFEEF